MQTSAITGDRYSVEVIGSPDVLWGYVPTDADAIEVAPPAIEVDGESTVLTADRFRYEIHSDGKRLLTKATGSDATRLTAVALPSRYAVEVRLSDYNSLVHSYVPTEVELGKRAEFAESGAAIVSFGATEPAPAPAAPGAGQQLAGSRKPNK
ncbi:MAG TPA: hypothetical protein VGD71_37640 [Kribbella sp.]